MRNCLPCLLTFSCKGLEPKQQRKVRNCIEGDLNQFSWVLAENRCAPKTTVPTTTHPIPNLTPSETPSNLKLQCLPFREIVGDGGGYGSDSLRYLTQKRMARQGSSNRYFEMGGGAFGWPTKADLSSDDPMVTGVTSGQRAQWHP